MSDKEGCRSSVSVKRSIGSPAHAGVVQGRVRLPGIKPAAARLVLAPATPWPPWLDPAPVGPSLRVWLTGPALGRGSPNLWSGPQTWKKP